MPARKSLASLPVWQKAGRAAADPQRVKHYLEQLAQTPAADQTVSPEQARILAALLSGSPASGDLLVAHPDWLAPWLAPEALQYPRREEGLRREVNAWLQPALKAREYDRAGAQLRLFKQREMVRIAARDLGRLGTAPEITREISAVADVCLSSLLQLCRRQLSERFGQPYHLDAENNWQPTEFAVIGLGKLGGQELNYSSDVDLMFVYTEEGNVFAEPPGKAAAASRTMTTHQFFKRLVETLVAELTRATPEGTLYRVDLRLRPEGDVGPLVRSLSSCENYYAQWGQTWERMMLIKARGVGGDPALAAEFIEMVQYFRYPRSLNEGFLREIATMKERIETEVVKAGELERNVKLGRGGIREIEFVVQTLQLLHAGRQPFLQGAQTLPLLDKLVQYNLLPFAVAGELREAYCFLRDVEHRLQMENYLQTHTIPTDAKARERLAALMGFASLKLFETALQTHTRNVRRMYDQLLRAEEREAEPGFPRQFLGAETAWKKVLAEHGFKDADKSFRLLNEFANGPGYVHVSPRTIELAWQLIARLLARCPTPERLAHIQGSQTPVLSDPDRVVTRLDSFISAYGTRAMLFETWASNPSLFDLLVLLFDRSEFLAETAIRTPDLVDELVLSGRLRRSKTAREILQDLRYGRNDKVQQLWLRRYHQAEFMRIGLRDILGLADFEQNLAELSALADACLQYALEVALRKHKLKTSPLVIIGLGKLGGHELDYGSDLDIIFVADNAAKNLPAIQKVALEVMDLLATPTELGVAFHMDARLRPDGEKGLLVNTLDAYEEYYRTRAQLWELQALTRTRPIAGDLELGGSFQQMMAALTDFRPENVAAGFPGPTGGAPSARAGRAKSKKQAAAAGPRRGLAAWRTDWKKEIDRMRRRIEKERTPAGQEALAIKTGAGGMIDAEFVAQTLCLAHGWQEPNTLRALERARDAQALERADADKLITNYRELRRVESILRRWSFVGEAVLPTEPAPYYRVSVRCGFPTPDAFRAAIAQYRQAVREVYAKVFGG